MGNYVSLADVAADFANSDRGKQLKAELERFKAESPARYRRKYSYKLTQSHLSAECNFACAVDRFELLNQMRSQRYEGLEIDRECFDELYEEYHQFVLDAAEEIRQYHQHRELLDQAILDEDAQREREKGA